MSEGAHTRAAGQGRVHIGVEPMLLALAMEFALKAWFVWDYDRHDPIRTHNLVELFDQLPSSSQERLSSVFQNRVVPVSPTARFMEYGIRDILEHHKNVFVEWRYLHEDRDQGISFDFSTFIATLELVLDEFGKRYETKKVEPRRRL